MEKAIRSVECEQHDLIRGRVKIKEDRFYWVETPRGLYRAGKAVSCLVEPCIHDTVLVSLYGTDQSYILSVLERNSDHDPEIVVDEGLSIKVTKGTLDLAAETVNVAGSHITMASKELDLQSSRANAFVADVSFIGRTFQAHINTVRIVANTVSNIADRIIQRARQSYRLIEDLDEIKAGRISSIARGVLFMKGKRSSLMAENKVKIDGEKIHLG
jgi:hypothetical protein